MDKPNGESDEISFVDSDEDLDSIKVQVIFSGIKKEEANAPGKILKFRDCKIPMSQFGSWVFHCMDSQESIDKFYIVPMIAFLWALYKIYPKISAWVDNPNDCSIVLEVAKSDKKTLLGEIGSGTMKTKVQEILSQNQEFNLKIRIIKIALERPENKLPMSQQPAIASTSSGRTKVKNSSSKSTPPSGSQTSCENTWKCMKLKEALEKSQDQKEKLFKLTELAICSYESENKTSEYCKILEEIKILILKVDLSEGKIATILEQLRKLSQLFYSDGKVLKSMEILLASAELVKKVKNNDDRIDGINSDLKKICEAIAKVYSVKQSCFQVIVKCEDEQLATRRRPDKLSGTVYEQAMKAQRNGKRALQKYKFEEALHFLDVAIGLKPNEMFYRLDKAEVFLAMGELEKCKHECEKALTVGTEKNKARAHALLAETQLRSYCPLQATISFQNSMRLDCNPDVKEKIQLLSEEFEKEFQTRALHAMAQVARSFLPFVQQSEQ